MFKVGTMLKAREVRLSRKKPPYHPALIPGTGHQRCRSDNRANFATLHVTDCQIAAGQGMTSVMATHAGDAVWPNESEVDEHAQARGPRSARSRRSPAG